MTPALGAAPFELPLFPLKSVLFPGGLLPLKVFEARYLDLVGRCLRAGSPFGVVCLSEGAEAGRDRVKFEHAGVLARIDDVDAEQAGILRIRCHGTQRFVVEGEPRRQNDGLWLADALLLPDDADEPPEAAFQPTVRALAGAIDKLQAQGSAPFAEPASPRRCRLGGQPLVRDPADPARRQAPLDAVARTAVAPAPG